MGCDVCAFSLPELVPSPLCHSGHVFLTRVLSTPCQSFSSSGFVARGQSEPTGVLATVPLVAVRWTWMPLPGGLFGRPRPPQLTILMNAYPKLKFGLLGGLSLLALVAGD